MIKLLLLGASAVAVLAATPAKAQPNFQHVVIVFQENRTVDNLFGGMCSQPGVSCGTGAGQYDIQTTNWLDKTAPGGVRQPTQIALAQPTYDISHSHPAWNSLCDYQTDGSCKMDGAAAIPCIYGTCPAHAAYAYVVDPSHMSPYYNLALNYGWGNNFHSPMGNSWVGHLGIFNLTTADTAADDHKGIMWGDGGNPAGCDAVSTRTEWLINGATDAYLRKAYPCAEFTTPSDLLEKAGKSWTYYGVGTTGDPSPSGIWMAPNSVQHICNPVPSPGQPCTGKEWSTHVKFTPNQVLTDLSKCALANMSWVIPTLKNSDHIGYNTVGNTGPAWVASIVNGVGNSTCKNADGSSYWDTTAIIVTWDDFGGWWDHRAPAVQPSPFNHEMVGPRVPLLVISAYTPKGYINNQDLDFGSIGRFVEKNFGITQGAVTFQDNRSTRDLSPFFSLTSPRTFGTVPSALQASDFLASPDEQEAPDDE